MKTLTDIIDNNQQPNVSEFLALAVGIGLIGMLATDFFIDATTDSIKRLNALKKELGDLASIRKDEKNRREEEKKERESAREERKLKREQKKLAKQIARDQKKAMKHFAAFKWNIDKMEDGEEKQKLLKQSEQFDKLIEGKLSQSEVKQLQSESKKAIENASEKDKNAANEAIDKTPQSAIEKYTKEAEEKLPKELKDQLKDAETISTGNEDTDDANNEKEEKQDEKPKEVVKDMEVTDPDTGKKVKRAVHIGPQGGKYYWPDKSPHDSKHKVYVHEHLSLVNFLRN